MEPFLRQLNRRSNSTLFDSCERFLISYFQPVINDTAPFLSWQTGKCYHTNTETHHSIKASEILRIICALSLAPLVSLINHSTDELL